MIPSSLLNEVETDNRATSDFFQDDYFNHDLRRGTLFSRSGTKMCYLSSDLLLGLRKALEDETGDAWRVILKRCGTIWGTRVARRFQKEIGDYFGRPLHDLPMSEFVNLVESYFRYHGWGNLRLDFSLASSGLIMARLTSSAVVEVLGAAPYPIDSIISGLLATLIAQVSDRKDIECFETECAATGAPCCRFVVGLAGRLAPVPEWVESGCGHDEVVRRLSKSSVGPV